jgi:phospholipid transport system substrate-binding protein
MQYRNLAVWTILVCTLVVGRGIRAEGGDPQERVRNMLDGLRAVLTDETLRAPEQRQGRQDKMHQIIAQHCNFAEMAQRSLGPHWDKITPAQRQEYLQIFSQLIEESLVHRIAYRGEKNRQGYGTVPDTIQYPPQTTQPGDTAMVRTVMSYANDPTKEEVEYLLHKRDGNWLIYDIVTEGASMLTNYRTQFDQIIRQESYDGLIERLKTSYRHGQAPSR